MSCNADVSIALTSEDFFRFKAAYENEAALYPEEFSGGLIFGFKELALDAPPVTGYKVYNGYAVIFWRSTRWAEGHDPQVDFIRRFLVEKLTQYQFLRIDEYSNVEFIDKTDGWDLIRPQTVVSSRLDFEYLKKLLN